MKRLTKKLVAFFTVATMMLVNIMGITPVRALADDPTARKVYKGPLDISNFTIWYSIDSSTPNNIVGLDNTDVSDTATFKVRVVNDNDSPNNVFVVIEYKSSDSPDVQSSFSSPRQLRTFADNEGDEYDTIIGDSVSYPDGIYKLYFYEESPRSNVNDGEENNGEGTSGEENNNSALTPEEIEKQQEEAAREAWRTEHDDMIKHRDGYWNGALKTMKENPTLKSPDKNPVSLKLDFYSLHVRKDVFETYHNYLQEDQMLQFQVANGLAINFLNSENFTDFLNKPGALNEDGDVDLRVNELPNDDGSGKTVHFFVHGTPLPVGTSIFTPVASDAKGVEVYYWEKNEKGEAYKVVIDPSAVTFINVGGNNYVSFPIDKTRDYVIDYLK